ncbi:MAG TPA: VIT1/CCC1 transporter family protein [Anaerolineae bacterium]|nr:VIT1/CCC1 transporter family protein [Anaerolineae bacterium]
MESGHVERADQASQGVTETDRAAATDVPPQRRGNRISQSLGRTARRWAEYSELSGAGNIARRAFANNSFDGVLTMVGVVMGGFAVGVEDPKVILVTGLSTAVAIGISGGWGAYLTESAERQRELTELERSTLTNLHESTIGQAARAAVLIVTATDGLSPFLAAFLVVIPFFLTAFLPSITYAFYMSLGMALLALFGLGVYLASVSQENRMIYGLKTAVAGVVCMGLSLLVEYLSG